MIGYTCKYTPVELLEAFGEKCVLLNSQIDDFTAAESESHANMCCHAKALLTQCMKGDIKEFIFVNCCDSVRRVYDIVKAKGNASFLFLLDLPHTFGECSVQRLASELMRLYREYSEYSGKSFSAEKFISAFSDNQNTPNNDFVAILGARVSAQTKEVMRESLNLEVADMTCSGNRKLKAVAKAQKFEDVVQEYARELLRQTACMRMADISSRKELLNSSNLKGIVYHTVKFCDYYSFEYDKIRQETALPILKTETDFTSFSSGQLSTRLEAFSESLGYSAPKTEEHSKKNFDGKELFAGIDSGSTSTNVVVIDAQKNIVAHAVVRTGARAENGAKKAFEEIEEKFGISTSDIRKIVATGYGRNTVGFADSSKTEITCHAKGANFINPDVRTVIDIGGQDSKVISVDGKGGVTNFVMNDKCAAGTGRFLEAMARTLEISVEELSRKGAQWNEELTISSMCTVFAESEVISLIAQNKSSDDIVHALNKAVASKTNSLAARTDKKGQFMMTGGVARNIGVVKAIEQMIGEKLFISDEPELCGALGAALFAAEE